ncbi:MAG: nucleotidyltransferase family protein [Chloroflexi bacterium]|nr:nucleotidyltransferase family protein [Chloroflexota bacterium]
MGSLAIVPAAGSAERFGSAKLLADVDGQPLLDRTVSCLLNAGVERVVVVLGPDADRIKADVPALRDPRVRTVLNPDASRGMFSSLQTGLALGTGDPILVIPGDMPFAHSGTVATLLDSYRRTPTFIVSPRHNGKRGHPVLLPPDLAQEIIAADPSGNLHLILRAHPDRRIDVDVVDRGVVRDVDVVGDLQG